jgi:transposase
MGGADVANVRAFVGLDVHDRQTHAGVLDAVSGEVRVQRIDGPPEVALEFLSGLPGRVVAVYEAGPSGFALARAAAARGLEVRVCSPRSIPRRSDRVKTDRRDALRLARLLAAGELRFVRLPSGHEEDGRDLVRAREAVRRDLTRARHRLTRFLARRGVRWQGPGNPWTEPHVVWLRKLRFDGLVHAAFADYLTAVEALVQRRSALDRALAEYAPQSPWADTIARLRCFRGIDTVTAVGLCAEIGDFQRFSHPRSLAAYLGIVPSEYSSAERRRHGSITKAGSTHARRLLVEAAHHYRHPPLMTRELARRQAGQDPRACQAAWRAQRRLHSQWRKLRLERRKPAGVVVIALGRELTAFIWEVARLP